MTREAKMFVMSAGVALTSVGLLVVRELGLAESASGRWLAISIIVVVLIALAAVLWRRP
jgi:hypothetical protein